MSAPEPSGPIAPLLARVGDGPIAATECAALVGHDAAGAVVTFEGVVRDHDGGRTVRWLDYSAHPEAEAVLRAVAEEVAAAHPGTRIAAAHRVGRLAIGDVALAAAVSAAHRDRAFAACAALVDAIKERVPIWKEQGFADGSTEWVGSA